MFLKLVICTAAIQEQFWQYTEDIYTAAGGSAYVEMVIYTAAGNQQKTLFTRQPCVHIKYLAEDIYAAAVLESIYRKCYTVAVKVPNRLHTRLPYMFSKMVICTAAIQEQLRQYTEDIYTAAGRECLCRNGYLHGRRESAENVIYTAAVCPHKIFGRGYIHGCRFGIHISKMLFTRQPFEAKGLYTRLPTVNKKYVFTRQPFKSQIGYVHGCRVST